MKFISILGWPDIIADDGSKPREMTVNSKFIEYVFWDEKRKASIVVMTGGARLVSITDVDEVLES